jgi:hypothetical protein
MNILHISGSETLHKKFHSENSTMTKFKDDSITLSYTGYISKSIRPQELKFEPNIP